MSYSSKIKLQFHPTGSSKARNDEKQCEGTKLKNAEAIVNKSFYVEDGSNESLNVQDFLRNPFYKSFSLLRRSLAVVGLHCYRDTNDGGNCCRLNTFSLLYCWAVTIAAWLMVIKSLSVLRYTDTIGPVLLSGLSMSLWMLLCAINATSFLAASLYTKSKRKFFMGFTKLEGGPHITPALVSKYVYIGTTISWLIIAFNMSLLAFLIFGTDILDVLITDPLPPTNTTGRLVMKFIFLVIFFYLTAMWVFPSTKEICMAMMMSKELYLFRKSFSTKLSRNRGHVDNLENERRRFIDILRILSAADSCFSLHHAASFGCNIVNACLILYIMIYYPFLMKVTTAVLTYIFWFIAAILDVTVVCFSGIIVNSAVSMF